MISIRAEFPFASDDVEVMDRLTDDVADALTLLDDILEPDVCLSMTEHRLEISLVVDTDDPRTAVDRAATAVEIALGAAGQPMPKTQVMLHNSLLGAWEISLTPVGV